MEPPKTVVELPKMPKMPKLPVGGLRWALLIVLIVVALSSSVYTIDPEEIGVITRFGKYIKTKAAGRADMGTVGAMVKQRLG